MKFSANGLLFIKDSKTSRGGTRHDIYVPQLGALSHPNFGWEGFPTKIDYRKISGTLILTSLLEDPG